MVDLFVNLPNDQKALQLMRRALWLYQKDYRS